ncbi:MAG TPA: sulfotransferase [Gemmatimonadales bacterium]|nr:sulfotransferase [Gemmatimonadales bacterium]
MAQPSRSQASRCVIVAGFPRSGTSWLARALSFAPGFTYYREPDNYERVEEAQERFAWLYLTADQDDEDYREFMTRACAGRIATAFTMRDDPGPLLRPLGLSGRWLGERIPALFRRKPGVLLKLVFANLNLDWLVARFPHARQVCALRHPCGQFESWRRLGWEPTPARLLENRRLMADHLHPFADLLRRASGFWERAGALWGATVYVMHRQTGPESPRDIVAYEWLCGDPVERFQKLYRRLDLEWSAAAERFLTRSNHEGSAWAYSLERVAAEQVDRWRPRLTQGEIDACRRFVEPFELPYYPDFEPEVASAAGDLSAR